MDVAGAAPEHSSEQWAIVLRAPHLGAQKLREVLGHVGDVATLLRSSRTDLAALQLHPETIAALLDPPREQIAADLRWLARAGTALLPFTAAGYPAQLAALPDAPPALYLLGRAALLLTPQLAIVGSRTPTAAGRRLALTLSRQLAEAGLCITSGLARGIDAAAHEGALAARGHTIAVCGNGLDRCYPAENRPLFERVAAEGLLVSEFAPGTAPMRSNFPRRNRIISGLARGTLVVEAAADSGSLITARKALDQGRELFVVPGSPLNPLAAGCLDLLREGAHLVRSAADVLAEISISIEGKNFKDHKLAISPEHSVTTGRLDKEYEMLLDALGFEPASIDDLVDRTGLAPGSVASMMLILELEGRVEARPGALFNRITD